MSHWIATKCVAFATRVLPRGALRDRYRQELAAELEVMDRRQATRYALGVLVVAPHLRRTIVAGRDPGTAVPLTCRLNLHHRWHICSTEDGNRFKECARCHKEGTQGLFYIWHYPGDDARRSFTS